MLVGMAMSIFSVHSNASEVLSSNAFIEKNDVENVCPTKDFLLESVIPNKFYRAEYDPEHGIWDAATEQFTYNGRTWTFHVFDYKFYGDKTIYNAMESAQTLAENTLTIPALGNRPDIPALYRCGYYDNELNGLSIFALEY